MNQLDNFRQFDQVFAQANTPPYADLMLGANLGFTPGLAKQVLARHDWLVFLNRLWDAQRVDGLPATTTRVPDRIWRLTQRTDELGQLHSQLLESTGMALPQDFDRQFELHVALWELAPAVRGGQTIPTVRCDGPVRLELNRAGDDWAVTVEAETPGRFVVELHWPGGQLATHTTPWLEAGAGHTAKLANPSAAGRWPSVPPASATIRREPQ